MKFKTEVHITSNCTVICTARAWHGVSTGVSRNEKFNTEILVHRKYLPRSDLKTNHSHNSLSITMNETESACNEITA